MTDLDEYFSHTRYYCSDKINSLLEDAVLLLEIDFSKEKFKFNDWAFKVAPAYKALEGVIDSIAEDIGTYKGDKRNLDVNNIEKKLQDIDKSIGSTDLSERDLKEIEVVLKSCQPTFHTHRNSPAHFSSNFIDTEKKASRMILSIFHAIDTLIEILSKYKVINPGKGADQKRVLLLKQIDNAEKIKNL